MKDNISAINELVKETKIVAIVRNLPGGHVELAKAFYDGGIRAIEVTFNQQKPDEFYKTMDAIRAIREAMGDTMVVGAGTVITVEQVDLAYEAGAQFIVTPDTNVDVIRRSKELGMSCMPGAMTPSEVLTAYRAGADFVKIFPAGCLGPGYVKAVCGPINHIPMLAVGGISEKNVADYMKAGCVGAGVGGNLVNKEWIANGEWDKITAVAKELCDNAKG